MFVIIFTEIMIVLSFLCYTNPGFFLSFLLITHFSSYVSYVGVFVENTLQIYYPSKFQITELNEMHKH